MVWYGDFTTYEHKTTTRQGGKGGGGVKQEDVKYTYEAAVMMALCEGEIKGVTRIWRDKEKFSSPASLRLTLYKGGEEQPVWPHLQQAKHAAQAISYSGTAYLCSPNYELTKSAQIYSHNFEVDGKLGYSTSIVDANPRDIIRDLLTNQKYGCGFPVENLGDTDVYGTYCRAAGIFLLLSFEPISPDVVVKNPKGKKVALEVGRIGDNDEGGFSFAEIIDKGRYTIHFLRAGKIESSCINGGVRNYCGGQAGKSQNSS